MKVQNAIKKVGAAAGSALMVGMTMGAAQTLGDFPQPFVTQDGQVQSQIVVGSQGKQADVVGAINIAATLGQSAIQTETKTKTVSTGGTGTFGWSATGGVTLDTVNDQLYLGDNLDTVRDTLTADQLDQLQDVTFQDDAGDETDIEFYAYPGNQSAQFGKPSDRDNQDPVFYVNNPADPDGSNYLFQLQANFEDSLNFTSGDVEDQEIQLFGDTWTVSTDTTDSELVLLGSQQTVDVDTGKSKTVTVGGSEVTIEAVSASDSDTGSFRVNGELKEKDEEQTVTVNGQEIRLDDVVQTGGSDSGTGVLQFAIGSDEIRLSDGNQIEDENSDDIDGTYVNFDSDDAGKSGPVDDVSTIEINMGSNNDDHTYVTPAEDGTYTHPLFEDFTFHFGGINPDATADGAQNVGTVEFSTSGTDTATVSLTPSGGDSSSSLEFVHDGDTSDAGDTTLSDDDGDAIEVQEANATVDEDEYVAMDAGDFPHVFEVTNIDRDNTGDNIVSGDEATIDLRDAFTGDSVTVDLDFANSTDDGDNPSHLYYAGTEVIDGQTYNFVLEGDGDGDDEDSFDSDSNVEFKVSWGSGTSAPSTGDGAADIDANIGPGDRKTLFAPVDTDSGAAVGFAKEVALVGTATTDSSTGDVEFQETVELPSTESTSAATTATLKVFQTANQGAVVKIQAGGSNSTTLDVSSAGGNTTIDFQAGQTYYTAEARNPSTDTFNLTIGLDRDASLDNDQPAANPSAVVVEPEDDGDQEDSWAVTPGIDTSNTQIEVGGGSGSRWYSDGLSTVSLESDDDINVNVSTFGTYFHEDTNEQGSIELRVPSGQSTAGAAVTGPEGSLTAGGGGGSGTVTYTALAGTPSLPDMAMLDSEVTSSVRQNSHLILVGGPAVNQLVSDLAQGNQDVWTAQQWRQQSSSGNARINLVNDAFTSGQDALIVAGFSASDTRGAARYLANYEANQAALQGKNTVSLSSADYPTAQ